MQFNISSSALTEESINDRNHNDFQHLLNHLDHPFFILDKTGQILWCNEQVNIQLGYNHLTLIGEYLGGFFLQHDAQNLAANLDSVSGQKSLSQSAAMINARGKPVPVEIRISAGTWQDEVVLFCSIREMTEIKRMQVELNMLSHALRNVTEGLSVLDLDGSIIFVNDAFLQTYGYSKEELIGHSIDKLIEVDRAGLHIGKIIKENMEDGWQGELPARRQDNKPITISLILNPIKDKDGKPVVVIAVSDDISEKKELEFQLQQSQKMEAIGQLAGGIAHDFNNLLTVIEGYTDLLLKDADQNNPKTNHIRQIKKASDRASSLTGQLLAFSRRQILQPKLLDISELIMDMSVLLKRLIGEQVELETNLEPDIPPIKADPSQIEQVIMNLCVNARDAMPDGGILSIELKETYLDEHYVRHHTEVKQGNYVQLSISDSGIGMSRELQERIFEPFFTTKKKGEGTGLGLATVYGIIKQSGGHIWVYSEPEHGTCFKIYFPSQTRPGQKKKKHETTTMMCQGHQTILVVEDEYLVRELVCDTLRSNGYTVFEASNGKQAIKIFETSRDQIDLILTDVIMPEMSGRKLVQELTKNSPDILAVYMSGYTDDAIIKHGVLEPGMEYIQKPFSPAALTRKLNEIFESDL